MGDLLIGTLAGFGFGVLGWAQWMSTVPLYEFLLPSVTLFPEQKEEKTSKRSQPVAMFMFPCFPSPAVCARAIHERGDRDADTVPW